MGSCVDAAVLLDRLIEASRSGNVQMVQLVLASGAGMDLDAVNGDGATALSIACEEGHLEVVHFLCEQGADKDKAVDDGATPLWIASGEGHLDVVHFLCEQNADKDKATDDGSTPLWIASQNGHLDAVRFLCEQGADKDKAMDGGITPLWIASQERHLDVARFLCEAQGAEKSFSLLGRIIWMRCTSLASRVRTGTMGTSLAGSYMHNRVRTGR